MRFSRRAARQIGDLNEQIRLGLGGLPLSETLPRIRVHQGPGSRPDTCELWGMAGRTPTLRRLCALPAGVGLRIEHIEKAAENAGFSLPVSDDDAGGPWVRIGPPDVPTDWFELALMVALPGIRVPAQDAGMNR
ncbi:hypothetical protein [Myceligenerans crystallogenes]|uniref:Uncharacterized protein n=1 Tax=Myceligenerans crystallogenes TaxID=316335 RepID=A0ABP4ZMH3_9MICO